MHNRAMRPGHLFLDAEPPREGERFDTLLRHRGLHIERIVSAAGVTSDVCVQAQDEWVLLVRGAAVLEIDGRAHELKEGDHVFLPAGTPHKVQGTSAGAMWLAVHLHPGPHSGAA